MGVPTCKRPSAWLACRAFTSVQENENERDNKEIKIRGDMVRVSMSILRILILELNLWSKLRY